MKQFKKYYPSKALVAINIVYVLCMPVIVYIQSGIEELNGIMILIIFLGMLLQIFINLAFWSSVKVSIDGMDIKQGFGFITGSARYIPFEDIIYCEYRKHHGISALQLGVVDRNHVTIFTNFLNLEEEFLHLVSLGGVKIKRC